MGFLSRKSAKPEAPKGTPKEIIEASSRVVKVDKGREAGNVNFTVARNKHKVSAHSVNYGTSQPVSTSHLETLVLASMLSEDCSSSRSSGRDYCSSYGGSSSDYSPSSSCSSSSYGD